MKTGYSARSVGTCGDSLTRSSANFVTVAHVADDEAVMTRRNLDRRTDLKVVLEVGGRWTFDV